MDTAAVLLARHATVLVFDNTTARHLLTAATVLCVMLTSLRVRHAFVFGEAQFVLMVILHDVVASVREVHPAYAHRVAQGFPYCSRETLLFTLVVCGLLVCEFFCLRGLPVPTILAASLWCLAATYDAMSQALEFWEGILVRAEAAPDADTTSFWSRAFGVLKSVLYTRGLDKVRQ